MKKLARMFILCMVTISLIAALGTASAENVITGQVEGDIPVVIAGGVTTLAPIRFAEVAAGDLQTDDTINITLPEQAVFRTDLASSAYYDATGNLAVLYSFSGDKRTISYTITRGSLQSKAVFVAKLPVEIAEDAPTSGSLAVTVSTSTGRIREGTYVVGRFGKLGVNVLVSFEKAPKLSQYGPNPQVLECEIVLTENGPGALQDGEENKVVLTLPKGILWANSKYQVEVSPALPSKVTVTAERDGSYHDRLVLTLKGGKTSTATKFMIKNPAVNVLDLMEDKEIKLSVVGENANSGIDTEVVLSTISGFNVTTRRTEGLDPFDVSPGRQNQVLANLEILEEVPGSFAQGGYVTITLPRGLAFSTAPSVTYKGLTGTQPVIDSGTDRRRISFTVNSESKSAAGSITVNFLSSGNIVVSPLAEGDVEVHVLGTNNLDEKVVLAKVLPVVEFKADSVAEMEEGAESAKGGDLVITEGHPGQLSRGVIELQLPEGVTFDGVPEVVREGNIGLGTPTVDGGKLTIPVISVSSRASTITIRAIDYKIARSFWNRSDKKISVTLGGNSVVDAVARDYFTADRDKLKAVNAAPKDELLEEMVTVFTIGSPFYTVGGKTYQMDQPPVIVEGRTMLPLRFAAEAVGVTEDDLIWDPVSKSVTLMRGNRVVQVVIGEKNMLLNGALLPMDVPASILNGRTMLPIRWIATALNAEVEWDAATKTVTIWP